VGSGRVDGPLHVVSQPHAAVLERFDVLEGEFDRHRRGILLIGLEQGVRVVLPVRGGHEDEADLIAQAVPDHRPIQGPTATEDQLVDVEDLPDLAHCFRHVQMHLAREDVGHADGPQMRLEGIADRGRDQLDDVGLGVEVGEGAPIPSQLPGAVDREVVHRRIGFGDEITGRHGLGRFGELSLRGVTQDGPTRPAPAQPAAVPGVEPVLAEDQIEIQLLGAHPHRRGIGDPIDLPVEQRMHVADDLRTRHLSPSWWWQGEGVMVARRGTSGQGGTRPARPGTSRWSPWTPVGATYARASAVTRHWRYLPWQGLRRAPAGGAPPQYWSPWEHP